MSVQVVIDIIYIPRRNPHSPQWFSDAGTAAIVHRNHLFRLYQQNKPSESKVKFSQGSNCCVLEADKLAHAHRTKESITS